MQSPWYKDLFPESAICPGLNTMNKFSTLGHGFRFATSIGGTMTGEGADVLIVDDPITPMQAYSKRHRDRVSNWFDQTLMSRLNDKKNGSVVVVMQRLHKDDLVGHLMKKSGWCMLNLTALNEAPVEYKFKNFTYYRKEHEPLDPKRMGIKELQEVKKDLGNQAYQAQYLQHPVGLEYIALNPKWLMRVNEMPHLFEAKYHSWDCACKTGLNNDYSVLTKWGVIDQRYYLLDVVRKKLTFPQLKSAILDDEDIPDAILIEDASSGQALIQELRQSNLPVIPIIPKNSKASRILGISHIMEQGRIFIPSNALWYSELEEEMLSFPDGRHDDIIDSIAQFLIWINSRSHSAFKITSLW